MDVMKASLPHRLLVATLGALPVIAPASPDDGSSAQTMGVELVLFSRDFSVTSNTVTEDLEIESEGLLPGVRGSFGGPNFRGDIRLLHGDLNVDGTFGTTELDRQTESLAFAEVRGTYGIRMSRGRLYTGVGITHQSVDSSTIDWTSHTVYLPVGFSRTTPFADGWSATGTIEGRIIVAGEEDIDSSLGDVRLDQNAGLGFRLSGTLRNNREGIEIRPYFEGMFPGDTNRNGGTRVEDLRRMSIGSELSLVF